MATIPAFDQSYYDAIWGTVHRHDYTTDLADALVTRYGPGRYLDIGTGCGHLILELRKRGVEAWGLEVSEYAIAHSCAPDFVRRDDVRNIPWAARSFDVVHSQGMWDYIPKDDIQAAWAECQRVGRIQHHTIDYVDGFTGVEQAVTAESESWWKDQFYPRVLVACPTYDGKEYCFQRWIDNVRAFRYPNYEVFVVDTSKTTAFFERWKETLPLTHIHVPHDSPEARINYGMEAIRQHFLAGPYVRWFNVEADILPPANIIELMLPFAERLDWMAHGYPDRNGPPDVEVMQGIGCCMFSRELMQDFNFHDAGANYTSDGWLWNQVRPLNKFRVVEMWGAWPIRHLRA